MNHYGPICSSLERPGGRKKRMSDFNSLFTTPALWMHPFKISLDSAFLSINQNSLGKTFWEADYTEDLCSGWSHKTLSLKNGISGTLTSVPSKDDTKECTIRLEPEPGSSVVLSVYKFQLNSDDQLIITDYEKIQEKLTGKGRYPDEQKSFIAKGALSVRYLWNSTQIQGKRAKFQFIFTQVYEAPCTSDEFQCRNRKCISRDLLCDKHNHCGDKSDQENCGDKKKQKEETSHSDSKRTEKNKRNERYNTYRQQKSECRKFIIIGGDHHGKIGGTGFCIKDNFKYSKKQRTGYSPCEYGEYECRNKKCISKDLVCDRHDHCGDNSDEENCYSELLSFACHALLGLGIAGAGASLSLFGTRLGKTAPRSEIAAILSCT